MSDPTVIVEARAWAPHYATPAGYRYWPHTELVAYLGARQVGRVLEVGCGNGANLWFLSEHATHVVGVDCDDQALTAAATYLERRQIPPERATLAPLDVTAGIPYADGDFGLVVDCLTSQHLPWEAHGALFREYRRLLAPGGAVWIAHLDASTDSWRGPTLGVWDFSGLALFPTVPLVCLPPREVLAGALEDAGFQPPQVRGLVRQYPDGQTASYAVLSAEVS